MRERARPLSGRRFVLFIIIIIVVDAVSSSIVHVRGNEWVKKERKTSVHLIRIHDDKKEERETERQETWFTYSIGGATAITCVFLTLWSSSSYCFFLPGVFFSIDERKASSASTRWIESECERASECSRAREHTTYAVLNCVKSCLGWWLFTPLALSLCLSPLSPPFFSSFWNFNQTASSEWWEEEKKE